MFEIKVEDFFSAAHHLLNYKGNCENPHGHNWKVEVYLKGTQLNQSNILTDFKVLKKELKIVLELLDHKDLNVIDELKNISPSSEIIAKFIYDKMKEKFENIYKVSVWETEKSCASYFEE